METSACDITELTFDLIDKEFVEPNDVVQNYQPFDYEMNENHASASQSLTNTLIQRALKCNEKKRNALEAVIKQLEDYLLSLKRTYNEYRSELINARSQKGRRKTIKRLGIPYFKDKYSFPCPINEDYDSMKKNKQLLYSSLDYAYAWTVEDKYELTKAVYYEICAKKLQEIDANSKTNSKLKNKSRLSAESKQIEYEKKIFSNNELIDSLISKWQIICWKQNNEENDEQDQLAKDRRLILKTVSEWNKNIDWLYITSSKLNGRHTDSECQAMWELYLNPKFSKNSWNKKENAKLVQICVKYNCQDWDSVALELDSYRSSYQCCVHFHMSLCEKFNRDKWTQEEDDYLKSIVEMCSIGNFVSWGKVAYFFKHRTKPQIYRHYKNVTQQNIKRGFFSIGEDILLLTLLKYHGPNFEKIKTYFPFRTLSQIRIRISTLDTDPSEAWSISEDLKIISYTAKHGVGQWSNLTDEIGRTGCCIRHRYRIIQRWFEANPNSTVENIPRRQKPNLKTKMKQRNNIIKKVVQRLLNSSDIEEKLNLEYITSIVKPILEKRKIQEEKDLKLKIPVEIQCVLGNFFKSVYKNLANVRVKVTNEFITNSATRIEILLNTLEAKIKFPSFEQIQEHPLLDNTDKLIIRQIIYSKQKKEIESSNIETHQPNICIPPSIESLTGFRGCLLHMHILKEHSRSRYEGYHSYVKELPHSLFQNTSYYANRRMLDKNVKNIELGADVFFKRLQIMFQWPFVIADSPVIPVRLKKEIIPKQKSSTPGRKPKHIKNYRINLMNEARLRKRALAQESSENPAKKQKTEEGN